MNLTIFKRKYRILLLFAVAGAIFLCFQIFSFKVLTFSSQKQHKLHGNQAAKILDDFQEVVDTKLNFEPVVKEVVEHRNTAEQEEDAVKLVLGVLVTQSESYQPKDGQFQCLQTKVIKILLSAFCQIDYNVWNPRGQFHYK